MTALDQIWEIGTDIGGTFTDIIAIRRDIGETRIAKVPSRPHAPVQAMLEAIEAVGLQKSEVRRFIHGTTRITNAIVEERSAAGGAGGHQGFRGRTGNRPLSAPRSVSPRHRAQGEVSGAARILLRDSTSGSITTAR